LRNIYKNRSDFPGEDGGLKVRLVPTSNAKVVSSSLTFWVDYVAGTLTTYKYYSTMLLQIDPY